jgi:hypothetical protein
MKVQALSAAVMSATMLSPQIMHNVVKARSGPRGDRAAHMRRSIELTRELLAKLEIAELALGWRKDDAA